jgi:hypothetical protein
MPQRLLLHPLSLMTECDFALSPAPGGLIHFL